MQLIFLILHCPASQPSFVGRIGGFISSLVLKRAPSSAYHHLIMIHEKSKGLFADPAMPTQPNKFYEKQHLIVHNDASTLFIHPSYSARNSANQETPSSYQQLLLNGRYSLKTFIQPRHRSKISSLVRWSSQRPHQIPRPAQERATRHYVSITSKRLSLLAPMATHGFCVCHRRRIFEHR